MGTTTRGLPLSVALSVTLGCGELLYPAPALPCAAPLENTEWVGEQHDALFRAPAEGERMLVFFHGNATDVSRLGFLVDFVGRSGVGLLLVEYPGYCGKPGPPTEAGLYASAERALAETRRRGVSPERTVLVGQSLGTGVATEMGVRGHGARVVLISPFTSIPDLVDGIVPWGLGGVFATHTYDNAAKAPRLRGDVWIAHGDEDWIVPIELGAEVARRAPHPKLFVFRGAGHNDLFEGATYERADPTTLEPLPAEGRDSVEEEPLRGRSPPDLFDLLERALRSGAAESR